MEQMCLAIRERGITGELERKLDVADAQIERYRRRSEALHKQVLKYLPDHVVMTILHHVFFLLFCIGI